MGIYAPTPSAGSVGCIRRSRAEPGFTPSPTFDLPPGTVLTREWQGALIASQVLQGGFAYAGQQFASLSEVARRITGTRWSGPAFFGLEVSGKTK